MDRSKKSWITAVLCVLALIFVTVSQAKAEEMEKASKGIKAVLRLTPEKSMVDVFLYDMGKGLRPMQEAKVRSKIKMPDGKMVEKDLMGMKMDGVFSYMNSLDMSAKGRYIFDISVTGGTRSADFRFVYDRR